MAAILEGDAFLRDRNLDEVGGDPVEVIQVKTTSHLDVGTLYEVAVVWRDGVRPNSTDRLVVLPRNGRDPGLARDWAVWLAP